VLQTIAAVGLRDVERHGVERTRASQARFGPLLDLAPRALARVDDVVIPGGIPARVYRPLDSPGLPILVYLHGGGFVLGSPDTHDGLCRTLAADAGCVVVSVDYRLAPEHPYPAAIDDALAAFRHVRAHAEDFGGRTDQVAVAGDSAGGALAALVCQRLREAGEPQPLVQALIYPCTDFRRVDPSHQHFAEGFFLTAAMLDWFYDLYLPDPGLAADPQVSPRLAADLRELAPALVLTAGFDPLRDEGQGYAAALREAGVAVEHRCHERLIHGFCSLGGVIPAARAAVIGFADRLRIELLVRAGGQA
jgi:acetyl esterase